jgi:2-dehydropantoate 2-reductase
VRYIIYGAGAIGGVIGGKLAEYGFNVVLLARGPHLSAMLSSGLTMITPQSQSQPPVKIADSVSAAAITSDDVVILTMKSYDTEAAVRALEADAPPDVVVVCGQNGVANERIVSRRGFATYGMRVYVQASHLEPGVVRLHAAPISGLLDIGRYPVGLDDRARGIAADLAMATYDTRADDRVMRMKYAKLLDNLGNALNAACGPSARESHLVADAKAEATACFRAAGIEVADKEEWAPRLTQLLPFKAAGGVGYPGSSSWQSLARGAHGNEADWLNGEIALLGRQHGVPTPVNDLLRRLGSRLARDGAPPGSIRLADVEAEFATMAAT